MRPSDRAGPAADASYVAELASIAAGSGITHTGVAPASILQRARDELHRRLDEGLADGMQFTYRNPVRSTDPAAAVAGACSIFVGAMSYWLPAPVGAGVSGEESGPSPLGRIARYAWMDHYSQLRQGLRAVATRLRSDGWKAVAFADDNSVVDREVAHLAGLGWFGKNANILLPGAGSYFVLGSVITTAPLPVASAPLADGCGSCVRCVDRCPTGAIIAPGVIDARRCLAWVLQKPGIMPHHLRAAVGDRMYGCDDCQDACPPTVRFSPRHPARGSAPAATSALTSAAVQTHVPIIALLTGTDDEVLATWGEWYLAGRDPRWIRRNALVVLGNTGDPADEATRSALVIHLAHPDPMLRAHAVWAARSLGLDHLLPASDPDPDVVAELRAEPARVP